MTQVIEKKEFWINKLIDEVIDENHEIFSQRNDIGKIEINSEVYEKFIQITVSDTGIGIPKDEIEKIFERFYIVDKSRSKEKAGSGLGLSIAKWIVDMHQGTVNVESEEGKGTKVIVILYFNKPNNNC